MSTNSHSINNILILSLIISFVLHFSLLQADWNTISLNEEVIVPNEEKDIQIPIEFIPTTQSVTTRQYSASEIESVKKLVAKSDDSKVVSKSQVKSPGTYSLNRARTALNHYLLAIREVIEKNKFISYPSSYSNVVGNVTIKFSISPAGTFYNSRVMESSGDKNLDKSALSAIRNASGKIKRPLVTGVKTIQTSAVVKYQYGL